MKIAVFYVWVPQSEFVEPTNAFFDSYLDHSAGVGHDLVVLAKTRSIPVDFMTPAHLHSIRAVGEDGYDIGAYMSQLEDYGGYDRIVMMGAYARILDDDWLKKLVHAGPLAGATGSWEIRPHLRTTALSVHPDLLRAMPAPMQEWSKQDCWRFEHGPNCLYRIGLDNGVNGVVVGQDGVAYPEEAWENANTYRVNDQENLLVADNHTDSYANGTPLHRRNLAAQCWRHAGVPTDPLGRPLV